VCLSLFCCLSASLIELKLIHATVFVYTCVKRLENHRPGAGFV
jgi:hypothetical protein